MSNLLMLHTLAAAFVSYSLSFELDGSKYSYAKFSPWLPCHNGSVSFQFRTMVSDGLLIYMDVGEKDYYQLKLIAGTAHLQFRHRENTSILTVGQNLNDNRWHTVDIVRDGELTTLKVDDVSYTRENTNFKSYHAFFRNVDEESDFLFVGGLPLDYNLSDLGQPMAVFQRHIKGSFRNIFFSQCGRALTSPELLDKVGFVFKNDECLKDNPCLNSGICVTGDDGIQCDCSWTDYTGEHCQSASVGTVATPQTSLLLCIVKLC